MKGYNFYADHESPEAKRKKTPAANAIAVKTKEGTHAPEVNLITLKCEGFATVFLDANSGVAWTEIDPGYLRTHCTRISEAEARELHPRLFGRLDN